MPPRLLSLHPTSDTVCNRRHAYGRHRPPCNCAGTGPLAPIRGLSRRREGMAVRIAALCLVLGAVVTTACSGTDGAYRTVDGGHADRGARALTTYGCGACHMIPGVAGADGMVGPPLTDFGRRTYIAGEVTNTEENLIRWIQQPQAIEPGTAMPNLGVTDQDARDMAAYLYTLH